MSVPKNNQPREEEEEESYGTAESMDPELYRATIQGDILQFVRAMERGESERRNGPPACCIQLGPQNNTALHIATIFQHHEIVKLICKDLPFFVAEKNAKGDTALHIAARLGDSLLVSILVGSEFKECGLGKKNKEGNTPLHEALRFHHEQVARMLIDKNRNMLYSVNKEGKSLLYLAAEAGYACIVRLLMENPVGICNSVRRKGLRYRSPVHAAILGRNIDILMILWEKNQSCFQIRCIQGWNPLHYAAFVGYLAGVHFLLKNMSTLTYQRDKHGFFPIHIASSQGHIHVIQEMLTYCPDSRDLLTLQGHNILHVMAKNGKTKALCVMLKMAELEKLENEKDEEGNTPLHIATIYAYPKIVSALTRDPRVKLKLENNKGLTALDISENHMEASPSFSKRLTWMALRVAGAPRSKVVRRKNFIHSQQLKMDNYRAKVNTVLLVASLVATVTFTAGFTIPGGYNNSTPNEGMATMLKKVMFQQFVICNTVAMYSSVIVVVTLIWAQLGDISSMQVALKFAIPVLGIALVKMSIAFMAGIHVVVSDLHWLAHLVLFMGSTFVIALMALYVPLCFLGSQRYYIFCYVSYYPFRLMLYLFGNYCEGDEELLETYICTYIQENVDAMYI